MARFSFIILERPDSFGSFESFAAALRMVKELGYDGVEFNLTGPSGYEVDAIARGVDSIGLPVVSLLTGTNYFREGLCLSSPRAEVRRQATERLQAYTRIAARFGAMLVIGQMQGFASDEPDCALGEARIEEALKPVVEAAERHGSTIAFDPAHPHHPAPPAEYPGADGRSSGHRRGGTAGGAGQRRTASLRVPGAGHRRNSLLLWPQLLGAVWDPGLKTIEDATEIRRRVLLAFELAERQMVEHGWHPPLNFVVIGAGPTGVEWPGAISDIAQLDMRHDFRHIDPAKAKGTVRRRARRVCWEPIRKTSPQAPKPHWADWASRSKPTPTLPGSGRAGWRWPVNAWTPL